MSVAIGRRHQVALAVLVGLLMLPHVVLNRKMSMFHLHRSFGRSDKEK